MRNKKNKEVLEENSEDTITQEDLDLKNEEIAKLEKNLEEEKKKTEEYISHSQRLQADFENFKKQTEKHNKNLIAYANENIILKFLDSYEDLERALENSKNEKELREGVTLIYNKLKNELEKEGLKEIPAKGEKFDPFKHEALMAEKNDEYENNYIIDELMKGYTLKNKVIKYSKVKVCKK